MDNEIFTKKEIKEAEEIKFDKSHFKSLPKEEGITIDDVVSKDLDDGISLYTHSDYWILSVSISDVASFVKKDSELFESAKKSVITKYLSGQNIPMLPGILSEDKLSLLENQQRPALTFKMKISQELEILDFKIYKSAFKSRRKLSYDEVDEILSREKPDKEFGHLAECYHLANLLLEKRRERGALVMYDFIRGLFTNEEGKIIAERGNRLHMANIIVQEFMILTNSLTAEYVLNKNKKIILRNHLAKSTTPSREEINDQFLLAKSNPEIIESLQKRINLWFEKAEYSVKLLGHFGLNLPAYTHITSPLRRFPDLVNQYILHSIIDGKRTPFSKDKLNIISLSINHNFDKIKDEKKDHYRTMVINKYVEIAGKGKEKEYKNIEPKIFKNIFYQACINNILNDDLLNEIKRRIKGKGFPLEIVTIIIFELSKDNKYYQELYKIAFEYLSKRMELSRCVINSAVQRKYLAKPEVEIKIHDKYFIVIYSFEKNNIKYSNPVITAFPSKSESLSNSSTEFLKAIADNSIVPVAECKIVFPEQSREKKKNTESKKNVNYTGKLFKLCSVLNSSKNEMPVISGPELKITDSGSTEEPEFICECIVKTNDRIFQATGKANKKILARNLASKELLKTFEPFIKNFKPEKKENNHLNGVENNIASGKADKNYIGMLLDLSAKYKFISAPVFKYREVKEGRDIMHLCTCLVIYNNTEYSDESSGKSKKIAKHIAAMKLAKGLEENKIIVLNKSGEYEPAVKKYDDFPKYLNYPGALNSICEYSKVLSVPEYVNNISGPANLPDIKFNCIVIYNDTNLETEYTSHRKTISKQTSALLMIHKLIELYSVKEDTGLKFLHKDKEKKTEFYKWNFDANDFYTMKIITEIQGKERELFITGVNEQDCFNKAENLFKKI